MNNEFKEVTCDKFYELIGKLDVCVSIENGKYPYTSLFKTRSGILKGKIVDYRLEDSGLIGHRYYIKSYLEN